MNVIKTLHGRYMRAVYAEAAKDMRDCMSIIKNGDPDEKKDAAEILHGLLNGLAPVKDLDELTAIYRDKKEHNAIGYDPVSASKFVAEMARTYCLDTVPGTLSNIQTFNMQARLDGLSHEHAGLSFSLEFIDKRIELTDVNMEKAEDGNERRELARLKEALVKEREEVSCRHGLIYDEMFRLSRELKDRTDAIKAKMTNENE